MFISVFFVVATAANTDTIGVSVTIINNSPNITSVDVKAAEDPTACTTTAIGSVLFNVTDNSGRADINLTATYVNFTNGATTYQATTCTDVGGSGNDMYISCTGAALNYTDVAGSWTITAYVEDNNADSDNNNANSMTYNEGIHVQINNKNITFGTVARGTDDNVNTDSPAVNFENCGNVALDTSVTGASITDGGSNNLPAAQFRIDDDNTPSEGVETNENELTLSGSAQDFDKTGGIATGNNWDVYFFLDVPSDQTPATYDTGVWTVTASKT